ncbi:MAG TPA: DUF92 domain-containing protein [Candidatus Kapabacteria bacterium]|nr:DUF92 domain-containing protein [Candidatus Kapabacteria bacterium]
MLLNLLVGTVAAGAIALVAYRAAALTASGAIATVTLGAVVFGLGGLGASVPLITFFVLSSALSRIGRGERRSRAEEAFEKGGRRDAGQVLANGGVAGALVLYAYLASENAVMSPMIFAAVVGSLAAAAADTWGTEIGILGRGPVISLGTLRRVEPGRSGGISAHGTIGAITGAAIVSASAIAWSSTPIITLVAATVGGVAGMLADGLAGATIQARRRCPSCGRLTERDEHCGRPTLAAGGLAFVGNDAVNVLCCLVGALVAGALAGALG